MSRLTSKQKTGLDALAGGASREQAAKVAGYANVRNFTAMTKTPKALEYLAHVKKSASLAVQVDAEDLLRQLNAMRLANYSEIIDEQTGVFLPPHQWPDHWQQLVQQVDIVELFEGRGEEREQVGNLHRVKFLPRDRVLKMFGDHVNISGFQQQQVHQHVHLHESADRIAAARSRAQELPTPTAPPTPHPQDFESGSVAGRVGESSVVEGEFEVIPEENMEDRMKEGRTRAKEFGWSI